MPPLTLREAAELLGLSDPATLRQAIERGSLKAKRLGPIWTVTRAEVERYDRAYRRRRPSNDDEGRND